MIRRARAAVKVDKKRTKAIIVILILILLGLVLLNRTRQALFRPQRVFEHHPSYLN